MSSGDDDLAAFSTSGVSTSPLLQHSRSSLLPSSVMEPVAGWTPSLSRPPPNLAASASARGPETGDPEMEETARREMVTTPLPPLGGGPGGEYFV